MAIEKDQETVKSAEAGRDELSDNELEKVSGGITTQSTGGGAALPGGSGAGKVSFSD